MLSSVWSLRVVFEWQYHALAPGPSGYCLWGGAYSQTSSSLRCLASFQPIIAASPFHFLHYVAGSVSGPAQDGRGIDSISRISGVRSIRL